MPIEYQLHMRGQFKYSYLLKSAVKSLAGSVVQVSVREIEMQPYTTKRNCLLQHQWSDAHFYKRNERGNCTVPWAMNNTNICSDNQDMERVGRADSSNEVRVSYPS